MSDRMHRLIQSVRIYTMTAFEVAVLGAGEELTPPDPALPHAPDPGREAASGTPLWTRRGPVPCAAAAPGAAAAHR